MNNELNLFLPFYTPKDKDRAQEILYCLEQNLNCREFQAIFVLQDDDTALPFQDNRISVLRLPQRPTYLDWVRYSQRLCPNGISVLANSDIHFDGSIARLREIFQNNPKSFVALSRYDKVGENAAPHPNPHWSQDTWAFLPQEEISPAMEHQLNIPLGTPRCDNKIAYIFSVNGFKVFNPMQDVWSLHVHETNLRYYDKTGDKSIKGGVAMVHVSPNLETPAVLDIEIWSENTSQYSQSRINTTLEKWEKERALGKMRKQRVYGFDSDWQYPAITEKWAYNKMVDLISPEKMDADTAYFGFPWATLIDLSTHAQHRADRIQVLQAALEKFKDELSQYTRVITVCQHIRMRQFPHLFSSMGITDIYWSHCEIGQNKLPEDKNIRLHPFPLYPVQQCPSRCEEMEDVRETLFSFVGAKSNHIYLTQSRNRILDLLNKHPRGMIIDRDTWHYNKIVYDKQILGRADPTATLVDESAADQFRSIMSNSIFSLCPSGTGPNSIRLWESAFNNSIPVVIADTYQHPGNEKLWSLATVECEETDDALRALPNRLEEIAANPDVMRRKKLALYLLVQKYGPGRFVHDILERMTGPEEQEPSN